MSDIVGEAVLRIRTDDSDVNRGITSAGKKGGEGYSKGFKDGLKGLAGAAGLAFGADKAVDFLKSGIEAATSFQDETGALNVIIGKEGTAAVQKFGETSAKAFGISKVQALEASHTFATFGKSAGLSGKGLGDFSVKFASLAGDLASFNGGSTEDAITAIGAALRGESEPIRRYGVLLDDMSLRQEGVRLGILKNIKTALTPQQRVLAAQALIFKQTKDAQGDFARTSTSAANSQKALTAQFADLRLELGTKLLPLETKVVRALSNFVSEMDDGTGAGGAFVEVLKETAAVGKSIVDFFDGLPGPVKKYGVELVIAAFAISKVSNGLDGLIGKLKTTTIGEDGIARSSYAVGAAMRNLAGAGGLLLLQKGLSDTQSSSSDLNLALGGLATGFAVGGPLGAAIGGLAGVFAAVVTGTDDTTESFDNSRVAADAYAGSIDGVTGALKANSEQSIGDALQKSNPRVLQAASALGISTKTLVRSLEGQPKAIAAVNLALRKGELSGKQFTDSLGGQAGAADVLKQALHGVKGSTDENVKGQKGLIASFRQTRKEEEEAAHRTRELIIAFKHVPTSVATEISAPGAKPTLGDIETLIDRYHRTPSQVRTLVKALNIKPTKAELDTLIDHAHTLGATNPHINVTADTSQARASLNKLFPLLQKVITGFGSIDIPGDGKGRLQSGTDDWRGGLTTIAETGPELIWLPKHAQVTSAPRTKQLLDRAGAGSGASAQDIGVAVAKALVAAGVSGATIVNPVPEMASVSQARVSANTAFLLGG